MSENTKEDIGHDIEQLAGKIEKLRLERRKKIWPALLRIGLILALYYFFWNVYPVKWLFIIHLPFLLYNFFKISGLLEKILKLFLDRAIRKYELSQK